MALPPGFDLSAMQNILNNPEIRQMAEQMASDPSFQAITQQLAGMGLAPGGAPGMPPMPGATGAAAAEPADSSASTVTTATAGDRSLPAAGAGAGAGAGMPAMGGMGGMPGPGAGGMPVDPEQYMKAMQNIMQNPEFAKMAEDLGKKMFENDPQLASMVQTMQDPGTRNQMETKMKTLKDDPELKHIIEELETGGPAAMMKYWNDAETMQKIGKAFGDMPGLAEMLGGPGGAGGAAARVGGAEEADEGEEVDSAFLQAAMEGDLTAVKKFIADGAADFDVNEQDGQGRSALHFACGYGETAVVKELLQHKANVTCLDSDKNTPLHYAAGYGETECVKLLLEQGAGLTEKNGDGKTPLDVAKLNEQDEIAEMLQDQEKDAFL